MELLLTQVQLVILDQLDTGPEDTASLTGPNSNTGATNPQGATENTGTLDQLELQVKLVLEREIKETLKLLAKLVRLVKQEPLVSLEKQVQQETLVTLELLLKRAMSEILVLWEQLD